VVLVVAADDHDGQEAARRLSQQEADRALATEVMARVRAEADAPDEG
jgi:hypothetical protein